MTQEKTGLFGTGIYNNLAIYDQAAPVPENEECHGCPFHAENDSRCPINKETALGPLGHATDPGFEAI